MLTENCELLVQTGYNNCPPLEVDRCIQNCQRRLEIQLLVFRED